MIKFCPQCAASISYTIPAGDNRQRAVCAQCRHIHYENPKLVVGCIAEWQNRILLCRRAIEPRHGLWTLPAGFMENGETTEAAAVRETLEEACASIVINAPFAMISIPHVSQVHLFYRGRLLDGDYSAGEETLEANLYLEEDIPWKEIAFHSVSFALQHYFLDRKSGIFTFHSDDFSPG